METVNRFRETIILSYNFKTVGGHKHCPGKTMSGPQSPFFFVGGGSWAVKYNCRIKLTGLTFMGLSLKDFQSDRDLHL